MKRSTQVALLLMGAAGIGASAYALSSSSEDCVPANAPKSVATAVEGKDVKSEPCPPRRSYATNNGYYRSSWRSSTPTHWWTPIFSRRSAQTSTTPSSTSLGFTRPSSTSTTSRPSSTSTTRFGFGTFGRSFSISS